MTPASHTARPATRLPRVQWMLAAIAAVLWLVLGVAVTVIQAGLPPVLWVLGAVTNVGGAMIVATIAIAGSRPRPPARPGLDRAALRACPALIPIGTAAAQAVLDGRYNVATTGAADTVILVVVAIYLTAVLARGPKNADGSNPPTQSETKRLRK